MSTQLKDPVAVGSAQVKEEPAQRAGDTEQSPLLPGRVAASPWQVGGRTLQSRFFLGTAGYPSPQVLQDAIRASGAQVVTVGLRRQLAQGSEAGDFFALVRETGAHLLPNTAGCHTAREAITLAHMARELFDTPWIKLEVIGDAHTLQPDPFALLEAATQLVKDGFTVFPYCLDDLVSCQRLLEYMRIPCDQHEMAQILSVDVQRGANALAMQKSLARVDQKYGVTFKPLVNPELYYSSNGRRRVSTKVFASIIKEHVDKGVPLLWALALGQFPEEPPLPEGGQVSGGHMRMIIGYNAVKNQILFTDSWGAGHEKKRMNSADAYEATLGLYSMSPRGL